MTGICALLLSLAAVAGATATAGDAFAQSNTDRLVGLVDTTNRNHAMLEAMQGILGGLAEQIAAVQTAITTLAGDVSALSEGTAAIRADVDGLAGKADSVNMHIGDLDGKVDAIGVGVAGLTGKVDSANAHVDGVGAKVDSANAHIGELAGKVDAINVCTGELAGKVDAIGSSAADLTARMGSAESGAAMIRAEVDGLKTMMAEHASANQLDPSYAERLDMIPDIRAALAALGERPDNTAALNAISDGIKANSARIAALEDTINAINSNIAGVAGKLNTVETAVERNVAPAPTSLHKRTVEYDVTVGHFGDSAKGKAQGPALSKLTATYALSCKADVFLGKVGALPYPHLHDGTSVQGPHSILEFAVMDKTLFSNYYDHGGANKISYRSVPDFELMELKAGKTLDFASSWFGNHTNVTGSNSGIGQYILMKHGETNSSNIRDYLTGSAAQGVGIVPMSTYTKAELGAIPLHNVTVAYYSPAENAECSFKRTSGFSTDLDREAQKVLSVRAAGNQLVNGFEEDLDCNSLPTMITGINTEVPGGLSLHQHSTFQLLAGSGDKEKTLSVFKFNRNGTISHSSGDFPFTFEGSPLRINGTLAGAAGILVVVDYKTTEDNSCR